MNRTTLIVFLIMAPFLSIATLPSLVGYFHGPATSNYRGIALSPDGTKAYITDNYCCPGAGLVILYVSSTAPPSSAGSYSDAATGNYQFIAISSDGNTVYITDN